MPLDSNTCFGKGCQDAVVRPGRIDEVDGVIYECVGADSAAIRLAIDLGL